MKMKYVASMALGVLMMGFAGAASASSITLTGTVRDFLASHPDMEVTPAGGFQLKTGLVENTLGGDKNPVSTGANAAGAISSVNNFNQWFNDVPGTNSSTFYDIMLSETAPGSGIYSYSNSNFFPIDGQLFGNEGRDHNYHFTYEIHSEFTYTGDEFFSFTGDDDLWVFIDDYLAVDLGGVHSAISGSVDLGEPLFWAQRLTIGENYSFDLFFAERHTTQSNFKIETSIVLGNEVPEPATMLLFGTGLAGLIGGAARRRKKD